MTLSEAIEIFKLSRKQIDSIRALDSDHRKGLLYIMQYLNAFKLVDSNTLNTLLTQQTDDDYYFISLSKSLKAIGTHGELLTQELLHQLIHQPSSDALCHHLVSVGKLALSKPQKKWLYDRYHHHPGFGHAVNVWRVSEVKLDHSNLKQFEGLITLFNNPLIAAVYDKQHRYYSEERDTVINTIDKEEACMLLSFLQEPDLTQIALIEKCYDYLAEFKTLVARQPTYDDFVLSGTCEELWQDTCKTYIDDLFTKIKQARSQSALTQHYQTYLTLTREKRSFAHREIKYLVAAQREKLDPWLSLCFTDLMEDIDACVKAPDGQWREDIPFEIPDVKEALKQSPAYKQRIQRVFHPHAHLFKPPVTKAAAKLVAADVRTSVVP